MTHTPGPWQMVEPDSEGPVLVETVSPRFGFGIAYVSDAYMDYNGTQPIEAEWHPDVIRANALLIAAAPDLLAACELALARLREQYDHSPISAGLADTSTVGKTLIAAIAKARGQS